MSGVAEARVEAREFADTVAAIAARHPAEDVWRPGGAASDHDPALERALADAGWDDIGRDEALLPFAAPAAAALGRAFASLAPVDRLLGGSLRTGELARYVRAGDLLVEPRGRRLERSRAGRIEPLPYTDALGVARVEARDEDGTEPVHRMAVWAAASTGYLAGLAEESLRLAVDHARLRHAFGAPLTALEPVQQMLADAATLTDGLRLLTGDPPGEDALAHAGEAAERVTAISMQVTGALGFTLEFPLQRAYRRSRAARTWADAVLESWGP
jgi:3-oxo-4-pregnene-20-carboxyl-CoA dehydrogenase alpha subunit